VKKQGDRDGPRGRLVTTSCARRTMCGFTLRVLRCAGPSQRSAPRTRRDGQLPDGRDPRAGLHRRTARSRPVFHAIMRRRAARRSSSRPRSGGRETEAMTRSARSRRVLDLDSSPGAGQSVFPKPDIIDAAARAYVQGAGGSPAAVARGRGRGSPRPLRRGIGAAANGGRAGSQTFDRDRLTASGRGGD